MGVDPKLKTYFYTHSKPDPPSWLLPFLLDRPTSDKAISDLAHLAHPARSPISARSPFLLDRCFISLIREVCLCVLVSVSSFTVATVSSFTVATKLVITGEGRSGAATTVDATRRRPADQQRPRNRNSPSYRRASPPVPVLARQPFTTAVSFCAGEDRGSSDGSS